MLDIMNNEPSITNFTPEQLESGLEELIAFEKFSLYEGNKNSHVDPTNNELQADSKLEDAFFRYQTLLNQTLQANVPTSLSPAAQALKNYISKELEYYTDQALAYQGIIGGLSEMMRRVKQSDQIQPISKAELLNLLNTQKLGWQENLEKLPQQTPEAHQAVHGLTLKEYLQQYENGRIIRTPYVIERIASISEKLEARGIVIIGGHTGLGKTEAARVVAKDITGQEPVVVRGHPDLESEEMFGSQKLGKSNDCFPREIVDLIKKEQSAYKETLGGAQANPNDLEAIKERVLRDNSVTVSRYILKGVYQALKEGRVCIIDEGNYIDPGLIAKLNDILTKKPGEYIDIQEDGGEKLRLEHPVRLIITGNFNQTGSKVYLGRKELDPALVDRAGYVHYGVLPQETLGSLEECSDPLKKQLFTIAAIPLMSSRGGYITPMNFKLNSLWELAKVAALSQLAFAGNLEGTHPLAPQKDGIGFNYIPKAQISNRRLISIIESWKSEGFIKPLDYYVYQNFADLTDPQDRMFYYELAIKSGFFQEPDWPTTETFRDTVPGAPQIVTDGAQARPTSELIEALFGQAPVRANWSEGNETIENLEAIAETEMQLDQFMTEIQEELSNKDILRHLNKACPL
jgi:MoxR-like ATPase